jgi:hypothetical protein
MLRTDNGDVQVAVSGTGTNGNDPHVLEIPGDRKCGSGCAR